MSLSGPKKHLIYILGTFAFFLFTISDTIIKLIGDLYKDTVIFTIASFSAIIPVLIYLLYRRSFQEIKTSNYRLHIVRGILMTLTYYFIVKGIIILPLSIAYPIILSAPVLLSLLGILILKESRKDLIVPFFFLITTLFFYFYGFLNIQKFDEIELKKNDYKLRVIGSNVSLDRFYNDLDPVSVIEELIEISQPLKNEKIIFIWPEGILPGISQKQLIEYNWLFNEKFNDNHLLIIGINNLSNVDEKIKYFNSFSVFDHNLNLINSDDFNSFLI